MAKKKNKNEKRKYWCWYCDREFDEEKVLIQHQRMKHFQCNICHRKLNSASGLVIHVAQVHKETMEKVPNAIEGHDTPELEIFGTDGIPTEDLQRHRDGLPIVPYTKSRLIIGDASILPILAAQKASVAALLAESKNMTVQGDLTVSTATTGPSTVGIGAPVITSSASVISSAPIPAAAPTTTTTTTNNTGAASYWNNPYLMASYYQQNPQSQYQQNPQYPLNSQYPQNPQFQYPPNPQYQYPPPNPQYSQYPPSNPQYPQYPPPNPQYSQYPQFPPLQPPQEMAPSQIPQKLEESKEEPNSDSQYSSSIIIPPYVDPNTRKSMPGTIFTVLSLDQSLEEMRSDLKKYRFVTNDK